MLALAIESSCDETSLAIVQYDPASFKSGFINGVNSVQVLGHIISSQIKIHQHYGGVVPEIGAREHAEQIHALFLEVLRIASKNQNLISQIDQIFVTTEPGLKSALRVGLEFAKSLQFFIHSKYTKITEVIPVNHLHGHAASCFYKLHKESLESNLNNQTLTPNQLVGNLTASKPVSNEDIFPHLHLLVSGGNSQILLYSSPTEFEIIGKTLDDAAGECFDKTARMLGLKYPGGVLLSKIAGNVSQNPMKMPVSMLDNKELNFSFSGLKTAVRYSIQKQPLLELEKSLSEKEISQLLNLDSAPNSVQNTQSKLPSLDNPEINPKLQLVQNYCQSIQTVIVKQLMSKIQLAIKQYNPKSLGISGGVCANPQLRLEVTKIAKQSLIKSVFIPDFSLTGDNAVMIALAGVVNSVYETLKSKDLTP